MAKVASGGVDVSVAELVGDLGNRLTRRLPHGGAVALPRVHSRPRRGGEHATTERAQLGADEDQRHRCSASPSRTCGRTRSWQPLHGAGLAKSVFNIFDAPADGEADRGAQSPRGAVQARGDARAGGVGARGLPRLAPRAVRSPKPAKQDRLFAMSTAYVTLEAAPGCTTRGKAGIASRPRRRPTRADHGRRRGGPPGHSEETGTTVESTDDGTAPLEMLSNPNVEDLVVGINAIKDALDVGGFGPGSSPSCSASHTTTAARPLHLRHQARPLVPVRAQGGRAGARQRGRAAAEGPARRRAADGVRLERSFPLNLLSRLLATTSPHPGPPPSPRPSPPTTPPVPLPPPPSPPGATS